MLEILFIFNSAMSQYEAILKYLSLMDVDMVELILSDENLYQGVKKSTFISELEKIFRKWRAEGDTSIILEKGKCVCPKCQSDNLFGWTLIGNKTDSYLNLMFDVQEGAIKDIYYCETYYEEDGYYKIYEFENEKPVKTFAFHGIYFPYFIG